MTEKPAIDWYFDVVSPFAYLALRPVEALARRHPVRMRPIVFGALLQHWGQLGPAEIEAKRLHTYRLCLFIAERNDIPMRFPPVHPFRSLEAMRLLAALHGDPEAVRVVFDFVWNDGRDPGDPAEFAALCARLGVADFDSFIATHDAKARLRAATDEAQAAGVFGVPTLAIGGELFWGVDAMPMAERYLDDPAMLARGEMGRLAAIPFGVKRRA